MQLRIWFKKMASLVTALAMLTVGLGQAQAGMVGTDILMAQQQTQMDRQQLNDLLARADVQAQLTALGVDPAAAQARVASFTDQEVAMLNEQIENLPAGEGIGSLLLFLFVLFIITDMLGATDIFSFVKPIR